MGLPSGDLGSSQNGSWILKGSIPRTSVPGNRVEAVGEGHWVPPLALRSISTRREKNGSSQLTDLISKKDVLEVCFAIQTSSGLQGKI